jgi:hypothetical protein
MRLQVQTWLKVTGQQARPATCKRTTQHLVVATQLRTASPAAAAAAAVTAGCAQTLSTLQCAHSALSGVFLDQAALYLTQKKDDRQPLPPTLLDDHFYRRVYEVITSELCQKRERDTTVDPQRNTIKDTYDADELWNIVDFLLSKGSAETDRALAITMWSHSSVGRSDDVRLFYLADLITPQYIPTVGEYCSSQQQVCRVFHVDPKGASVLSHACATAVLQLL